MKKPCYSKTLVGVSLICWMVIFQQCRKTGITTSNAEGDFTLAAKAFFSESVLSNPRRLNPDDPLNPLAKADKNLDWDHAALIPFRHSQALQVPVTSSKEIFLRTDFGGDHFFRLNTLRKLLLFKDSTASWHSEIVTYFPDTSFLSIDHAHPFSGMVFIDDWWGNPINKYHFNPDGTATRNGPPEASSAGIGSPVGASVQANAVITTCHTIYGYNYPANNPGDGYHWSQTVCTSMNIPDRTDGEAGGGYGSGGPGGGSGGSSGSSALAPTVAPPYLVIKNLPDYLKCFDNTAGATYQVTLGIDQPEPGTRTPWVWQGDGSSGSISPIDVGHTFLIFTEHKPNGETIVRNIGFYPSASVTPFSDPVLGVFNDDSFHNIDIGASFSVTNPLFFSMLSFVQSFQGRNYQVNTNNCTNFALFTLQAGHIYLPWTIGGWVGGLGVDPGDLGEDIRSHDYQGMTRILTTGQHTNEGFCN